MFETFYSEYSKNYYNLEAYIIYIESFDMVSIINNNMYHECNISF
jgi:hypothetical protein